MNHETTIKQIQSLVPEVMALEFGCEVEEKPAFGSGMRNDTFNGGKVFTIICKDNSGNWLYLTDGGFGREKEDNILSWHTILGKPITLAVFLMAVNSLGEDTIIVDSFGNIKFQDELVGIVYEEYVWDLSKDNFNDQSEETKTFIGGLLK